MFVKKYLTIYIEFLSNHLISFQRQEWTWNITYLCLSICFNLTIQDRYHLRNRLERAGFESRFKFVSDAPIPMWLIE